MTNNFLLFLLLRIFLFSALVEYIFFRFLSRLGPVFPEGKFSNLLLAIFFRTGSVALNFAAITGLLFLFLWPIKAYQEKRGAFYPLLILLAFMTSLASFLFPFINPNIPAPFSVLMLTGISWFIMLLAMVIWFKKKKEFLLMFLVFLLYTLAYLHFWLRQDILSIPVIQAKFLLALSELLAVIVPVLTVVIYKPRGNKVAITLAAILSGLVFILYIFKPGVAAALAMWNQSFTGYLPFLIYPVAVGLYIYNITALFNSNKYKTLAVGLALIALGGLRLEYNYFNFLALAGFLLLAGETSNNSSY